MNQVLNIAIAGLGTVGQGVFKILTDKQTLFQDRCGKKIAITAVSARNKSKDRGLNLANVKWYDNPVDIAFDNNVDVVVELIGGSEGAAYDLVKNSLENKKNVVTANKALIARHGVELAKLAEDNNVSLKFEASVAGGIPIIKAIKEGLIANKISKIIGILNGTCNFILTKMEKEQRSFDDVLLEAQKLGYAEADPSFDIDGIDAAHKLVILSSLAFSVKPNFSATYAEGIRNITLNDIKYANHLGYKIKLLAIANINSKGKLEQRVHPCLVEKEKDIAQIYGVLGAVKVVCDSLGEAFFTGAGAGMFPTASAVVADIIDVANGSNVKPFIVETNKLIDGNFSDPASHEGEFYLRFSVKDEDGVLSSIASVLSNNKVGFEKLHQEVYEEGKANLVIITHNVTEENIKKSLSEISKKSYNILEPLFIRIEE
jgi:homoserine dehydrogenase